MRVVVAGYGQLGSSLVRALAAGGHTPEIWTFPDVDITEPSIAERVADVRPDVVINAAAWTNVDAAETNPEAAYAINALGPHYLAEGCSRCGALLLQVSTNEIFAGTPGRFYFEYDEPDPGGTYARTKLAGERAAAMACSRLIVARVAWLFGPGAENFPTRIIAAADRLGALRVVSDEYGNPTYAPDAAQAMVGLIEAARPGIYHLTNSGYASRHEFALAVLQASGRGHIPVTPILSSEWVRASRPPLHAVLVNQAAAALGVRLRPWQEAVGEYLAAQGTAIGASAVSAPAPYAQPGRVQT